MNISIPDYVSELMDILYEAGYTSYAVGGCVRDAALGKEPYDWDVTTSAKPEQMQKIFSSFKTVDNGLKHGTLCVINNRKPVEITTMRVDMGYSDNRHPDSVKFTSNIETDLSRRDFTVNAMAYNTLDGFKDPFGGMDDIRNRLIKCVGTPDVRFEEDALRIMRGLRFASVLGFDIEKATAESIIKNKALLHNVAFERIRTELLKLLCGKNVKKILMDFAPVFFEIIPELEPMYKFPQHTPYHIYDIWEHTAAAVASAEPDPIIRMTMLLHDCGKPKMHTTDSNGIDHFKKHQEVSYELSLEILKRLRFSCDDQKEISRLIKYHDLRPTGNKKEALLLASELSPEFMLRLLPILRADAKAQNPVNLPKKLFELDKTENVIKAAISSGTCLSIKELDLSGDDLKRIGFKGKEISDTLNILLKKVVSEVVPNNRQALLDYSCSLKKE